jgi:hypothetical protein
MKQANYEDKISETLKHINHAIYTRQSSSILGNSTEESDRFESFLEGFSPKSINSHKTPPNSTSS